MKQKETKFLIVLVILLLVGSSAIVWRENEAYKKHKAYEEAMQALTARLEEAQTAAETINAAYIQAKTDENSRKADPSYRESMVNTTQLPVNAIGDSVMLSAVPALRAAFPNGYFDAAVSRSHYPLLSILQERSYAGTLGDPVVIAIGTNNPVPVEAAHQAVELCGERQVFWITTTNNWQFDNHDMIWSLADDYDNVTIIDWETASADHPEYFGQDGIHMSDEGCTAYVQLIRQTITDRLFALVPDEKTGVLLAGDERMMQTAPYMQDITDLCYCAKPTLAEMRTVLEDWKARDILPAKAYVTGDEEMAVLIRTFIPDTHTVTLPEDTAVDGFHLSEEAAEALAQNIRKEITR